MNADAAVVRQLQQASHRLSADCRLCELNVLCEKPGQQPSQQQALQPDLQRYRRGDSIFRRGDTDRFLYSVRSGAVKLTRHRVVGEEQVLGFYFPGDVFGFDGLSTPERENEARAMQDCLLCRVPLVELTAGKHSTHSLHRTLRLFGDAALHCQDHAALVNQRHASTRLAAFLLDIANRAGTDIDFTLSLPMSRQDIGSYLGLSVETVSRRLCDMERDQLIAIDDKRTCLRIVNLERLQQLAHF